MINRPFLNTLQITIHLSTFWLAQPNILLIRPYIVKYNLNGKPEPNCFLQIFSIVQQNTSQVALADSKWQENWSFQLPENNKYYNLIQFFFNWKCVVWSIQVAVVICGILIHRLANNQYWRSLFSKCKNNCAVVDKTAYKKSWALYYLLVVNYIAL